jgi:hypothetical protein
MAWHLKTPSDFDGVASSTERSAVSHYVCNSRCGQKPSQPRAWPQGCEARMAHILVVDLHQANTSREPCRRRTRCDFVTTCGPGVRARLLLVHGAHLVGNRIGHGHWNGPPRDTSGDPSPSCILQCAIEPPSITGCSWNADDFGRPV